MPKAVRELLKVTPTAVFEPILAAVVTYMSLESDSQVDASSSASNGIKQEDMSESGAEEDETGAEYKGVRGGKGIWS